MMLSCFKTIHGLWPRPRENCPALTNIILKYAINIINNTDDTWMLHTDSFYVTDGCGRMTQW